MEKDERAMRETKLESDERNQVNEEPLDRLDVMLTCTG